MAILFSTGYKNAVLTGGSVREVFTADADRMLTYYSGPVPASADAALDGSNVPLVTFTVDNDGSTGLLLADTASNGVLQKDDTQAWQGEGLVNPSGTGTFWRFWCADDGDSATSQSLSTAANRIQGSLGVAAADIIVPSTTFVYETVYTLNYFAIPLLGAGE